MLGRTTPECSVLHSGLRAMRECRGALGGTHSIPLDGGRRVGRAHAAFDAVTVRVGIVLGSRSDLPYAVDSVVRANTAAVDSGGIFILGATASLDGSIVEDNVAGNVGGGIVNEDRGDLTLTDSQVRNNEVGNDGGGVAERLSAQ